MTKKALLIPLLLSFLLIPLAAADSTNLAPLSSSNYYPLVNGHSSFVSHNGVYTLQVGAFRIEPYINQFGGGDREVNSKAFSVSAGDVVRFECDIEMGASSLGDTSLLNGGEVNIDVYGYSGSHSGRIEQINNKAGVGTPTYDGGTYDYEWVHVPFGTSAHLNMTWTVASHYHADGFYDGIPLGEEMTPQYFFILIGVHSVSPGNEGALLYLSNTELYINPSGGPYPTPNPSATPYPTSNPNNFNYPPANIEIPTDIEADTGINPVMLLLGLGGFGMVLYQLYKSKR